MTSLRRFTQSIVPLLLVGSCANLIGLTDYETGEASDDEEAGGEGNAGRGGTAGVVQGGSSGTGGKPGMGGEDDGGNGNGGTIGGRPTVTGGTSGDGGMGGEPEGGEGGNGGTGGKGGTGGAAGGGRGGMSGSSGGGATGNGGSGGSGGSPVCTEIVLQSNGRAIVGSLAPSVAAFMMDVGPELGSTLPDTFQIQFWDSGGSGSYDGARTGSFMVGTGPDSNYASCSRCLLVFQDETTDTVAKTFFQTEGTVTIPQNSTHMTGFGTFSFEDVTLREVTIDPDTDVSTIVPGGECLFISTMSYTREMPTNWLCTLAYYSDADCDCGCGQLDPTCANSSVGACEYCWCNASGNCPQGVVASTNWLCQ